ncbi:HNH endonuclease signature motif containing protein [Flexivirga meconopsidis]|uniref:HNH endonuclease signature motif containing protein n=1 Tax=Flexivirga meconopsidis TaxID=2977121 RepID=UPI0022406839|nr:HNH endonuclease signature motif containing protein [Flexivirga meconopsidis]
MSQLQQALTNQVITAATTSELLQAAHTLLRAAFEKAHEPDGTGLSDDELLDQVLATQQVQNSAWATQTLRLDQLAQREYDKHPHHPDTWTPLEVGARLGWTDRQTSLRLTQATESVRYTPRLVDHAGTGELEGRKVIAVSDTLADAIPATGTPETPEAADCPVDLAATIEAEILASAPESSTSTKLRRRTGRLLTQHAPVAADHAAAARRRESTDVTVAPHWEPGMSTLTAVLPSLDAAKLITAINTHARVLHGSTTTGKSLGECRVDALTDLLLSNAQVATELVLQVPFHPDATDPVDLAIVTGAVELPAHQHYAFAIDRARLGCTPAHASSRAEHQLRQHLNQQNLNQQNLDRQHVHPTRQTSTHPPPPRRRQVAYRLGDVHVSGVGVIPATVIRELTDLLGTTFTRALVNADTGTVAETANQTYTPGARLARFVRARDQHCRFPGCTRPATLTDLDHITPYPNGPTAAHNLQCLCRHHHRAKHEAGWTVTMTPDGVCTWTSPVGHTYLTHPAD